jgi:membrane-associated phospholipid phosphatase
MNKTVSSNYSKLTLSLFYLPLFLFILIVFFLYKEDALRTDSYIQIQKNYFFFLNSKLSQFPNVQYNLTQLGDTLIFFSFLTIFIVYIPEIWEVLITASLVSALFSNLFKSLFAVPRPAATFDKNSFVIIGETLSGHNSLPSGHSITVFTTLTVLMFALMPKETKFKVLWCFFVVIIGLFLVFTRVGVGAHYPLDVLIGGLIGYISGLVGIFINRRYNIWAWIKDKKYYPIFILLLSVSCFVLINKIIDEPLVIFYLSLISLIASLYIITKFYVKK